LEDLIDATIMAFVVVKSLHYAYLFARAEYRKKKAQRGD